MYTLFYVVQDGNGDTSRIEIDLPTGTAIANVLSAVGAFGALLNPLLTGGLLSAGFTVEVDISGTWGPIAQLLSDVQEKAEFVVRTANGFLKRLNLPTIDESLFASGGSSTELDLADDDVAAFVAALEDGVTVNATVVAPVDSRGDDLVTVIKGRENWGKRRL